MSTLTNEQVVRVIFKVQYSNSSTRSFSKSSRITKNLKFQRNLLISISEYIALNSEHYDQLEVKNILLEYSVLDTPLSELTPLVEFIEQDFITSTIKIEENKIIDIDFLPKTMDLFEWSPSITVFSNYKNAQFNYDGLNFIFYIYKNSYTCVVKSTVDSSTLLRFIDEIESPRLGLNNFTRTLYKSNKDGKWLLKSEIYKYSLGELVSYSKDRKEFRFIEYKKNKNIK